MENAEGSLFCEITDVGEVALKISGLGAPEWLSGLSRCLWLRS